MLFRSRSKFSRQAHPRAVTVRFEPHGKGEVFTFDRIHSNGQAAIFSVILYLDGKERDFQGNECSGTLFSRRLDSQTVEIGLNCDSGLWVRFIRRLPPDAHDLILDLTGGSKPNDRSYEHHLVLEKQASEKQ